MYNAYNKRLIRTMASILSKLPGTSEITIRVDPVVDGVKEIEYCWVTRNDGKEKQWLYPVKDGEIKVPIESSEFERERDFKVTAYGWKCSVKNEEGERVKNGYFQNCGTIIFRVWRNNFDFRGKDKDEIENQRDVRVDGIYFSPPKDDSLQWVYGKGIRRSVMRIQCDIPYTCTVDGVREEYEKCGKWLVEEYTSRVQDHLKNNNVMVGVKTVTVKMEGGSIKKEYRKGDEFKGLNCIGFIRTSQMEYEWPFVMTGGFGIKQIKMGKPTIEMVEKLVRHGSCMCGFSADAYKAETDEKIKRNVLEGLVVLSVGAVGYVNGYSEEQDGDKTDVIWSGMGTNEDCSSMGTAGSNLVYALKHKFNENDFSGSDWVTQMVVKFIQTEVVEARIVSGWVDLSIANPLSTKGSTQKETIDEMIADGKMQGHVWSVLFLRGGKHLFVECTSPFLPHVERDGIGNVGRARELYGGIFNLQPNIFLSRGAKIGYGPAQLQPIYRYKAIGFMHGSDASYSYHEDKARKKVGCPVSNFLEGIECYSKNCSEEMYTTKKTQKTQKTQKKRDKCLKKLEKLMYDPDFSVIGPIIESGRINLRDKEWTNTSFEGMKGDIVVNKDRPPLYHVRFIPSAEFNRRKVVDFQLRDRSMCIYTERVLPSASGIYIGTNELLRIVSMGTTALLVDRN